MSNNDSLLLFMMLSNNQEEVRANVATEGNAQATRQSGMRTRGYTSTRARRLKARITERERSIARNRARDEKNERIYAQFEGVVDYLPQGASLVGCLKEIFSSLGAHTDWTRQEESVECSTDSLFSTWQAVMDGPLRRKISTAISLLVALGMCRATGSVCNIDFGGFTIFSADIEEKHRNAFDFMAALTDTAVFFASRIVLSVRNGNLVPFAFSDASAAELTNKVTKLRLYIEALGAGNHEIFYDMSQKRIQKLLLATQKEAKELEANVRGLPRTAMTRLRAELESLSTAFTAAVRDKGLRPAPFAFLVYGPSGVGKSSVSELCTHVALKATDVEYTKDQIVTHSLEDEYDSNIRGDTVAIRVDDIGNSVDKNDVNCIIRFVNNVPCTAVKAELEGKGAISISPKVLAATSNLPDMGAYHGSRCPASITRRMNLRITPIVKEKFRMGDSLDSSKVLREFGEFSLTNDVWDFIIDVPTVTSNDNGKGIAGWIPYDPSFPTHSLASLMKIVAKEAVLHRDKQRDIVGMQQNLSNMSLCKECSLFTDMCDCETATCEGVVDEIMHPVFRVIETGAQSRYKKICALAIPAITGFFQERLDRCFFSIFDAGIGLAGTRYDLLMFFLKQWTCSVPVAVLLILPFFVSIVLGVTCCAAAVISFEMVRYRTRAVLAMRTETLVGTVRDYCVNNTIGRVLFGTTGLALLYLVFESWRNFRRRAKHEGVDSVTFDQNKIVRANVWAKPFVTTSWTSEISKTSTGEQMTAVVSRHCVTIDGFGKEQLVKGLVLCNNLLLIPNHLVRLRDRDVQIELCRGDREHAGTTFKVLACFSKKFVSLEKDACFVPFVGGPTFGNIIDRFAASGKFKRIECSLLDRSDNGIMNEIKVLANYAGPERKVFDLLGHDVPEPGKYVYKWPDHYVGACGAPLVKIGKNPHVLGLHTFNTQPSDDSGIVELTHDFVSESVAKMNLRSFRTEVQGLSIPKTIMGKTVLEGDADEPHSKSPLRYVPDGYYSYMGSVGGRITPRTSVRKTGIYEEVLDVFEIQDHYGPPPYNSITGDQPWFTFQNGLLRKCERRMLPINSQLLDDAYDDYVDGIAEAVNASDMTYGILTNEEAIFGIHGDANHNGVDFSTSVGFPLTGPKRSMLSDPEWDGSGDRPEVDSRVLEEVARMEACYRSGVRAGVIWKATPKDEPTKNDKNKVRIFCSANMPMTIFWKKYTEKILAFIRRFNYTCETAVGLNAHSDDWHDITCFLRGDHGDNSIYGGDYSCYDDCWHAQLTSCAMDAFLRIGRLLGMDSDTYKMLRVASADIITPLVAWNGDLIMLHSGWVSGFLLTCDVGGIANSLLNRCAAFSANSGRFDFRHHVRLLTTGDDHIGGVRKGSEHMMNHMIMKDFLTHIGIKYTMPDKTAKAAAFLPIEKIDFLKRGFRFDKETQRWHGPLDLRSIHKSLTWCVKSTSVSQRERDASAMEAAVRELFFHGRKVHDEQLARVVKVAKMHNMMHLIPSICVTFDEKVVEYITNNTTNELPLEIASPVGMLSGVETMPLDGSKLSDTFSKPINYTQEVHSPSTKGGSDEVGPKDFIGSNALERAMFEGIDDSANITAVKQETVGKTMSDTRVLLDEMPAALPGSRQMDMNQDAGFANWLSAPDKIFQVDVAIGTRLDTSFNPWEAMISNRQLAKKLSHNHLFTCDGLEIEFFVKGSPFMSGKFAITIDWGYDVDHYSDNTIPLTGPDVPCVASNKPLAIIDPTTSSGAQIELPMILRDRAMNIPAGTVPPTRLRLAGLAPLRHVNNGTAPLSIIAIAHFINPQVGGRTSSTAAFEGGRTKIRQALRRTTHRLTHAIKKGAHLIEDVVDTAEKAANMTMKNVLPMIPEMAQAGVEMLACAGLDKRNVSPDADHYHATAVGSMTSLAKSTAFPLTVDPKAQLGVSSALLGFNGEDHMSFAHIFSHWYTMAEFDIDPLATGRGDILFSTPIGPNNYRKIGLVDRYYTSGDTFLSQFFEFWRGAYEYRFVISRASAQRMVLRVVFEPDRVNMTELGHNNVMSTLIDVVETTDHSVVVPYEQATYYLPTNDFLGTSPRWSTSGAHVFPGQSHNGVLSVLAETVCTSMNPASTDDALTVSVMVRPVAGEFTFSGPLNRLGDFSFEGPDDEGDPSLHESTYQSTHGAYTYTNSSGIPSELPLIAGTENFFNLADIIHKEAFLEAIMVPGQAALMCGQTVRRRFPPSPGPHDNNGMDPVTFSGAMTPLAALSFMYTYRRGNVTGKLVPYSNQSDPAITTVTRSSVIMPGDLPLRVASDGTPATNSALAAALTSFSDGSALAHTSVNEVVSYDAPDVNPYLAEYCRANPEDFDDFRMQQVLIFTRIGTFNDSTPMLHYVAGGDTMRFYGYVGPPFIIPRVPP